MYKIRVFPLKDGTLIKNMKTLFWLKVTLPPTAGPGPLKGLDKKAKILIFGNYFESECIALGLSMLLMTYMKEKPKNIGSLRVRKS